MAMFWGYLIWLVIGTKLAVYALWLWRKGYRLGAVGTVLLAVCTLSILLVGTFGNGLK